MYILYSINGGSWTGKKEMTKSSDGNTFTFTFPDKVGEGKSVLMMFASDHLPAENSIDAPDWSKLQGNDWVQYSCGTQVKESQIDLTNTTGQKLTHQGNVLNVLKIGKAGKHTVTLTKESTYSSANQDLKFTYTTSTGGSSITTRVNLPLNSSDFAGGKAHYFLVGTRMADWRLQPEWELEDLGNNKVGIKLPRIMYTGLISVAKVSSYDDYANSRYTRFSSSDNNGKSFYTDDLSSALTNKGNADYYTNNKFDYNSVDRFCAAVNTDWNNDAVQKNQGVLCNRIEVTLDGNGDPSNIEFTLSANPFDDVNKYLTFSLVGGSIINAGMDDADKTAKGMSTWQDAWVQYDPVTGLPYRDAKGRLFYQTVFQSDWLDMHPSFFNKKLADGRDFNYTSQSIIMRNVSNMTDAELAEDDYAEYYKRFENNSDKTLLGKNDSGDQDVKIGDKYDYKEFMKFHDSAANPTYGGRSANWQCFVVKDMWMDGTFKVWTGWGGGLKNVENTDNDNNTDARWYYVNGGHGHANCKGACSYHDNNGYASEIRGYDILRKGGTVGLFGTKQDVNQADFSIANLTYFKRVIVWYDPKKGFDNSAVQLIIERLGPAIQAVRGELGSEIDYTWSIPDVDGDFTNEEKAMHVAGYTITRYKLNEETGEFESMGIIETLGDEGKTVADYINGVTVTDKDLKGGTYRYRVDLKLRDSGNNETSRFAMSNRVTLFDASQPVIAKAFQITEGEGDSKKYSFDLELDLDLANFAVSASYDGKGVTDLATGYLVHIAEGTQNDLNEATAKTVTCNGTTGTIGNFTSATREVIVNGATLKKDGCWIEIPFEEGQLAKKVVWENIIKSVPGAVYNFDIYLIPNEDYKTIFADANFGSTSVSTEFFIPGIGVEYEGADVVTYNPTGEGIKLAEDTPGEAMPMGAHNGDKDIITAPVQYTAANNLRAEFSFTEPAVTDKVKNNFTLDYGYAAENKSRNDLTQVAGFAGFDNYRFQEYLDVTSLAATYAGTVHDGNEYLVPATGPVIHVMTVADVKYSRNGKTALPLEMAVKEADVSLPALVAPEFSINGKLTTNEQDDVKGNRYYVHELYANIELTNTYKVGSMVARPGFHLVPSVAHNVEFANDFGNTGYKDANGGVIAYSGLFGFDNDFYSGSYLSDYTPFTGNYDDSNNWAYSAWGNNRIPVYVNYFSAQEKSSTADYTAGIPELSGVIAYHYPFVVKKAAAANVERAGEAAAGQTIVTLTAVSQDPMNVTLPVMTAISDVEADGNRADAEFYNLQGIRVAQPQPGQVYLVRRGAEVAKVLYR